MSFMTKLFTRTNAFVLQITNGRLGGRMGKQSVLLLHTIGRKSGQPRTTPLSYYRDGKNYLVVASNWGQEAPPNWLGNLTQQPRVSIQVKNTSLQVEARQAEGQEYQRLWALVTSQNSQYIEYQKMVKHTIPIVILAPIA
jgi:deazaflavin-dependent oxidoreductase (nitroreductase family)